MLVNVGKFQTNHKNGTNNTIQRRKQQGLHQSCMVEIGNEKYVFRDVIGVGNCAFEAIRATGKIPNMTVQDLRKEICEFARYPDQGRTIAEKLKPYIGSLPNYDNKGLDEYLNKMSIDRQWEGYSGSQLLLTNLR